MPLTFKRSSLVAQVTDAIRLEIRRGTWMEWLPSERELSRTLHGSRNTCRFALQLLYREGIVEPRQGLGARITRSVPGVKGQTFRPAHSVGVIIPEGLARLRPSCSLVIEELQAELYDMPQALRLGVAAAAASLSDPTCSNGIIPASECLALHRRWPFRDFP